MTDEIKLQVVTSARFDCGFDVNGICAVHGTSIMHHDAITTTEFMTLEEAKHRYPDTDPATWEKFGK